MALLREKGVNYTFKANTGLRMKCTYFRESPTLGLRPLQAVVYTHTRLDALELINHWNRQDGWKFRLISTEHGG